jgi:hypothetical protein
MTKIRNGSDDIDIFLEQNCTAHECSTALFIFLRSMKRGLFPERVQHLINGRNNQIPHQIIALDALGLLYEESRTNKRNFVIIMELLKLMKLLSTKGNLRPTEQHVSHAPLFVMPLLFDKRVRKFYAKNSFTKFLPRTQSPPPPSSATFRNA